MNDIESIIILMKVIDRKQFQQAGISLETFGTYPKMLAADIKDKRLAIRMTMH